MRISDWSSDVCSSDLPDTFVFKVGDRVRDALGEGIIINHTCNALTVAFDNGGYRVCTPGDLLFVPRPEPHDVIPVSSETMAALVRGDALNQAAVVKVCDRVKTATHGEGECSSHRAEERRVGKEGVRYGRSRGFPGHEKKKNHQ